MIFQSVPIVPINDDKYNPIVKIIKIGKNLCRNRLLPILDPMLRPKPSLDQDLAICLVYLVE